MTGHSDTATEFELLSVLPRLEQRSPEHMAGASPGLFDQGGEGQLGAGSNKILFYKNQLMQLGNARQESLIFSSRKKKKYVRQLKIKS